jgi:hypothetical protein
MIKREERKKLFYLKLKLTAERGKPRGRERCFFICGKPSGRGGRAGVLEQISS